MKKTDTHSHTIVEYKTVSDSNKKRHIELMAKHTTTTVQKIANLNFASLKRGTTIQDYDQAVPKDYQESVDFIEKNIQGKRLLKEQKQDEQDTAEKFKDLKDNIDLKFQALKPLKARLDEGAKSLATANNLWKGAKIGPIVFIFLEMGFNYSTFFSLGGNLISSIASAFLVSLAVYFYAHYTPEKVRKYGQGNIRKELVFFVLYLIPVGLVFYLLASLRLSYLTAMNAENPGYDVSPWTFTCINLFVYVICYWIVYKLKPSKEDRIRYKDYQNAFREIQQKEGEIVALKEELSALEPALRERTTHRYGVLQLGKQLENEIQTCYEQCLAEMKLELLLRTNGEASKLYTNDTITPLRFNYQSLNLPS